MKMTDKLDHFLHVLGMDITEIICIPVYNLPVKLGFRLKKEQLDAVVGFIMFLPKILIVNIMQPHLSAPLKVARIIFNC